MFTFTSRLKPSEAYEYFMLETSTSLNLAFAWTNLHTLLISPCHSNPGESKIIPALSWQWESHSFVCSNTWDSHKEGGLPHCGAHWKMPKDYLGDEVRFDKDGFASNLEIWFESIGNLSPLESVIARDELLTRFEKFNKVRKEFMGKNFLLTPQARVEICQVWNDNS